MTEQQIKENAPEGATHYTDHGNINYYKLDGNGTVYVYRSSGFGGYCCLHLHISEAFALKPL